MVDKIIKCSFIGGQFRPCWMLGERLQEGLGFTQAKGLFNFQTSNFKTGKITQRGAVYKAKGNDRGLALNFCPWCGENIQHPDFREKTEAA